MLACTLPSLFHVPKHLMLRGLQHCSSLRSCGRDVQFVSYFWKTFWAKMGTKLKFSSAFHPQTDGQTEVVNRSLANLLRCLVTDHHTTWDLLLPQRGFCLQ
jgi:hypothetical protein